MSDTDRITPPNTSPALSLLVRLLWMLVGNAALGLCGVAIIMGKFGPLLSLMDLVFWLVVLLLLGLRYLDITRLNGTTADEEPATLSHWRRYAVLLVAVAAGFWLAAHAIAFAAHSQ